MYIHPITVFSARAGKGYLPMKGQFMTADGNIMISAVKTAADEERFIVRLADISGADGDFKLTFSHALASA